MDDIKYAIPAALFFCTLAVLLYLEGNSYARFFVLFGLFVAALGQYAAQDPAAFRLSQGLTYAAIICTFVAMAIVALF